MKRISVFALLGLLIAGAWFAIMSNESQTAPAVSGPVQEAKQPLAKVDGAPGQEQPTNQPNAADPPRWAAAASKPSQGYAHRSKAFALPTDATVKELLPQLVKAAEAGDVDAAAKAGAYLSLCEQRRRAAIGEAKMKAPKPDAGAPPVISIGEIALTDPIDQVTVGGAVVPIQLAPECVGLTAAELRLAPKLLERAASNGNEIARMTIGRFWPELAALQLGLTGDAQASFYLPAVDELIARFPEAAALRERAWEHLTNSAREGNLDSIHLLSMMAQSGRNPSGQAMPEDAFFWAQVRALVMPETVRDENQRQYASYQERYRNDPAGRSMLAPAITGPDYYSSHAYFGVTPSRASAIRAAAETMAGRCCQRRPN